MNRKHSKTQNLKKISNCNEICKEIEKIKIIKLKSGILKRSRERRGG